MAELQASDVKAFTGGRLGDNDSTQLLLDAALAAARRRVGWHVSPVRENVTVTLDGPNSRILELPTQKLVTLTSLSEDGDTIDLDDVQWSKDADRCVRVRKNSNSGWSADYGSIVVVMTHGYTELEAAPWRRAILSMVDQMSSGGRSDADLILKRVDDVQYQWAATAADQALISVGGVLEDYCVNEVYFV